MGNPILICRNFLNTLNIVLPILIFTVPIVLLAIQYIAGRPIFKNFNVGFRILIGVIVFVLISSAIAMLFVYDGDVVINTPSGTVYLCQTRHGCSASVIKFQNDSDIQNCVFQNADSICKNENDPFRHLSNLVSVNGTLGAYVCSPTTSTEGTNNCSDITLLPFIFREGALLTFFGYILVFSTPTILCAPCLEKYKRIKCGSCLEKCGPTKSTETKTLLTKDDSL